MRLAVLMFAVFPIVGLPGQATAPLLAFSCHAAAGTIRLLTHSYDRGHDEQVPLTRYPHLHVEAG